MNERNKKMPINVSNTNGHSKISADMSTNVTLDVTDLTSLLHQAITQAKQLQTTMNQVNELMKGQFGGAPIPQLPSRS